MPLLKKEWAQEGNKTNTFTQIKDKGGQILSFKRTKKTL
jgi:hypothetical protein